MTTESYVCIGAAFILGMVIGVRIEREDAKERVQETSKMRKD